MEEVVISYNDRNFEGVAPRGIDHCVPGLFKAFCRLTIPEQGFEKFMNNVYYVLKTKYIKQEVYMGDYKFRRVEETNSVLLEATFISSNRRS